MSNKKTLEQMSTTEATRAGITSLADRPNDKSRYGDGGLTAPMLKERFDALPNLVREKFNKIAEVLAGTDAAKYIGLDGSVGGVDNLYDFLLLFGARGTGQSDKNISDYIETLYQGDGDNEETSHTLREIVQSIISRFAAVETGKGAKLTLEVADDGKVTVKLLNVAGTVLEEATAGGPVKTAGIADGAVTNGKLAGDAVTEDKIDDLAISEYKIGESAVTERAIRAGAVTKEKLNDEIKEYVNGAFKSASYDASSGRLTFTLNDERTASVNLPLEIFVTGGYFDTDTRDVVLLLANGEKICIPFDDYVEKVAGELKRIDERLPLPTDIDDGRFLKASGGKIVFSDVGDYQFPKMRAPLSVTVNNRNATVTVENRDAPFVLKNYVYIDGERAGAIEEGTTTFSFSTFVKDKIRATVGITAAGEGFYESDKIDKRWGLTNGTAGLAYSGSTCTGIGTATNMSSIEIATYNNGTCIRAIGESAFSSRTTINSITIPESITEIVIYAFRGCTNLHYVYYTGTLEGWCNIRLGSAASNPMYNNANLYIGGSKLTNLIIPDTVTDIKNRFRGCHSLLSAEIPESVTVIGSAAFAWCKHLADVKISDGVESIDTYAFVDCKSLTSLTIPNSVTSIEGSVFNGCTALADIYVPWAEGEVANAPWGAPEATIHYDSEV